MGDSRHNRVEEIPQMENLEKHIYVGLNFSMNKCCALFSKLSFEQLREKRTITPEMFEAKATGWCGCDDISRTLNILHLRFISSQYILPNSITFHGLDCDHGGKYEWDFTVCMIMEAEQYNVEEMIFCDCDNCGEHIIHGEKACRVKYGNKTLNFCENCYYIFTANTTVRKILGKKHDGEMHGKAKQIKPYKKGG